MTDDRQTIDDAIREIKRKERRPLILAAISFVLIIGVLLIWIGRVDRPTGVMIWGTSEGVSISVSQGSHHKGGARREFSKYRLDNGSIARGMPRKAGTREQFAELKGGCGETRYVLVPQTRP